MGPDISADRSLCLFSTQCVCGFYYRKDLRLEITVNLYIMIRDDKDKQVCNQGRTVNWVANPKEYALVDLEKDIDRYFKRGSYQRTTFRFLKGNNMHCKLASDAQLLDLLRSSDVV